GVLAQRRLPLRGMHGIAPAGPVRCDVGISALLESHTLGGFELGLRTGSMLGINHVEAVEQQMSRLARLLTGLCQRDGVQRTEPCLPRAAVEPVAHNPPPIDAVCPLAYFQLQP